MAEYPYLDAEPKPEQYCYACEADTDHYYCYPETAGPDDEHLFMAMHEAKT